MSTGNYLDICTWNGHYFACRVQFCFEYADFGPGTYGYEVLWQCGNCRKKSKIGLTDDSDIRSGFQ